MQWTENVCVWGCVSASGCLTMFVTSWPDNELATNAGFHSAVALWQQLGEVQMKKMDGSKSQLY